MDPLVEAGAAVGKELITKTSFYDDGLKPVVKEAGKALGTLGKTVNMCLSPLAGIVWGYEKVCKYVEKRVTEKLQSTPTEQIQTPKANIAVPVIEGIRTVSDQPDLQELYANLLASAMNKATASGVLPAFATAISELSSDEAKILCVLSHKIVIPIVDLIERAPDNQGFKTVLTNFTDIALVAKCEYPNMTAPYLENLERLKLIEIRRDIHLTNDQVYQTLQNHPILQHFIHKMNDPSKKDFYKGVVRLTSYGITFCKACNIQHLDLPG